MILERGRVGERWRSERWDSFCFQFPNWTIELPGYKYQCDDPDAFAPGRAVVRFLDGYADFIKRRCVVEWRSLHWSEHRTPGVICSIQITARLKLLTWSLPRVPINCP